VDGRTLRDAIREADIDRFVGREPELAVARAVLEPGSAHRILFVHGPGGIGKSALLRAVSRQAEEMGFAVVTVDPRTGAGDVDSMVAEVQRDLSRPLCVVIDEAEALGSHLVPLRDRLLDLLPESARVVVASRQVPHPSWREGGLDTVLRELALRPLPPDTAVELLGARGVTGDRIADIVAWAQGSPLALTVAASTGSGRTDARGTGELQQRLTTWLAGRPILDVPPDVLEVAALARTIDARLLHAVLPARATREGMRRLALLPVVEQVGSTLVLHAVLAAAIRARLRETEPERESELVCRIAEHLADRARMGDLSALIRLSWLIETPAIRNAIGNEPSDTYYPDVARPGEMAHFARLHGFDRGRDWAEIADWLQRWPDHTLVMRRIEGHAVMVAVIVRARLVPGAGAIAESLQDGVTTSGADPDRTFVGIVMFAEGPPEDAAEAARLGSGAFVLQRGAGDLEAILLHYPPPDRRPAVTAAIAGELEGGMPRQVAISDFRPWGAIGSVEAFVLAEHGRDPRPVPTSGEVRALLADDRDPVRIARLRARLDLVFADNAEDQRLRRALELVHLGERATEEECLAELHVSRRSWFRLLRTARERLVSTE
jgi:hypothetical protein